MSYYGRLLSYGAIESRAGGASILEPRHLLLGAIRNGGGSLAEELRKLCGTPRDPPEPAGPEAAELFVGPNQAASRLIGFAAGWALSRGEDEPGLEDLLVAALWGPDAPGVLEPSGDGTCIALGEDVLGLLAKHGVRTPTAPPFSGQVVWAVFRVPSAEGAASIQAELSAAGDVDWVLDGSGAEVRIHTADAVALRELAERLGVEVLEE